MREENIICYARVATYLHIWNFGEMNEKRSRGVKALHIFASLRQGDLGSAAATARPRLWPTKLRYSEMNNGPESCFMSLWKVWNGRGGGGGGIGAKDESFETDFSSEQWSRLHCAGRSKKLFHSDIG